ncbi:unnamed protein product [Adineta ricciae]|uniref:Uncharacterized protein n=1 Tax=Adineta ricciae TaxID=249248 RepID=A0A815N6Y6_ADIRI|nr:unnamed protein product [Adineta ricciae]
MTSSIENNLDSFIQASRLKRTAPLMANSSRPPSISTYGEQNGMTTYYTLSQETPEILRSLSPENVLKLKYKIELDKQVKEKQQRLAKEWEKKIERDKQYVQNQPFGRQNRTTFLNKEELQEILTQGRAPSPVLESYSEHLVHHQPRTSETYVLDNSNHTLPKMNGSTSQPVHDGYPINSSTQPQISNNNFDFQRFYGPKKSSDMNGPTVSSSLPTKGNAHDPFSSYDPNKDGQSTFNSFPELELYHPWGRPGAGAPLIHAPTGQKYTRYSGSLQDKLHRTGPLGYHQNQYIYNIEDQKRDLELEQKRRQQQELDHRTNTGNTVEWISQLNKTNSPLRFYSPTKETAREFADPYVRNRSKETQVLHDSLMQQAEERARLQKLSRQEKNLAELQHTESMNNWWGRGGSGAPASTNRRHNMYNSFEQTRQKWGTNHLGQLVAIDEQTPHRISIQPSDFFYPRNKQFSSHRNFYEIADDAT